MSGLYTDSKAAQVGVTVSLSFLVVTDLIGNTLVILIILTNKSMKSPMNYLLLNLAVADIMVGIFFTPQFIFSHFFTHPDGLAGSLLCKLLTGGNISWIGGAASVVSLVAISFERYFAVIHPYSTKLKLSIRKVKRIVVACWIFAVVLNIPVFLAINTYDKEINFCVEEWPKQPIWLISVYSTFWLVFAGIMPVTIMFVLYSRVIYTLWFKRSEHQVQGTQLAVLKSRKRVTKMIVIVTVVFALCWLPDCIMYLLYHYGVQFRYGDVPLSCSIVLVTCNSAINPFIYTFQSEKFRRHLKELVCCRKLRRNRANRLPVPIQKSSLDTAT